ncbi:MAG: polyhydroxyalkanoate synthesis regulator DNA-binding domain-containing protein [Caldilineaceae bacterium]
MPLIKRYPNRKLYDTEAKQYVTLEQIAELIRAGQDVQVIDHESGEDLTSLTLSQVILDLEKRQSGFLPSSLMTSLIRSGGETVESVLRLVQGSIPLGATMIEDKINRLVSSGVLSHEQAHSVANALQSGAGLAAVDDNVAALLNRLNIPTSRDLDDLRQKLASLNAQLDALTTDSTPDPASASTHPTEDNDNPA